MDNIQSLEELGLDEVSRKTHIEAKFIRFMINKEFNKLNRVNTLGFAKILKREYKIDMDSWLEEYNNYYQENHKDDIVISANTQNLITDEAKSSLIPKKWLFILLLILVLIIYFAFYGGVKKVQNLMSNLQSSNVENIEKNDTNKSIENIQMMNETKVLNEKSEDKILEEVHEDKFLEDKVLEETNIEQNLNKEEKNNEKAEIAIDSNKSKNEILKAENNNSLQEDTNLTKEEKIVDSEVYIKPQMNIWLGIINLETKKRSQYTSKDSITINLQKPQIVVTGHDKYTLVYKSGKSEKPKTLGQIYYYIDNGTITSISKKEFMKYNGGKFW